MTGRGVLAAFGTWIVLSLSLWATDSHPAVLVLGGVVAVGYASVFATIRLAQGIVAVDWLPSRRSNLSTRSTDPHVNAIRQQVYGSVRLGSSELSTTLVELVDDRLRVHRHIDRAADPEAAMQLLTPPLRRLVSGSGRQVAQAGELRRILTDIEAL